MPLWLTWSCWVDGSDGTERSVVCGTLVIKSTAMLGFVRALIILCLIVIVVLTVVLNVGVDHMPVPRVNTPLMTDPSDLVHSAEYLRV